MKFKNEKFSFEIQTILVRKMYTGFFFTLVQQLCVQGITFKEFEVCVVQIRNTNWLT